MLNRVINTLKEFNHNHGFERYLENIQRSGLPGTPTVQEARRDYEAVVKTEYYRWI